MDNGEVCKKVDNTIKQWQQGDCYLGELDLPYLTNPEAHIASDEQLNSDDPINGQVAKHGVCLITQTCDLVRSCEKRPFMNLAPLVEVEGKVLQEIKKQRRPRYAFIPNLEQKMLVVDLDFITSAEKSLILEFGKPTKGFSEDYQRRIFSKVMSRKLARTAFPDAFVKQIETLRKHLTARHSKQSPEGKALRALREIRVRAAPSWDSDSVEVNILFIREESQASCDGDEWEGYREKWMKKISPDPYSVCGELFTMESLSAKDYHESDPLDLDNLSQSSEL